MAGKGVLLLIGTTLLALSDAGDSGWERYAESLAYSSLQRAAQQKSQARAALVAARLAGKALTATPSPTKHPPVGWVHFRSKAARPLQTYRWRIKTHRTFHLNLTCTVFHLEYSLHMCRREVMFVEPKPGAAIRIPGTCGYRLPWTRTHPDSQATVVLLDRAHTPTYFSMYYQPQEAQDRRGYLLSTARATILHQDLTLYWRRLISEPRYLISVPLRRPLVTASGVQSFLQIIGYFMETLLVYVLKEKTRDECLEYSTFDGPSQMASPGKVWRVIKDTPHDEIVAFRSSAFVFSVWLRHKQTMRCRWRTDLIRYHPWTPHKLIKRVLKTNTEVIARFPNRRGCHFLLPRDPMTFCLLKVMSPTYHDFPQVELLEAEFGGPNTRECDHAGIQFMEQPQLINLEDGSVAGGTFTDNQPAAACNKLTLGDGNRTIPFTKFVSNDKELFIGFYIYRSHGFSGTATISITLTKCQGFRINCYDVNHRRQDKLLTNQDLTVLISDKSQPYHIPKVFMPGLALCLEPWGQAYESLPTLYSRYTQGEKCNVQVEKNWIYNSLHLYESTPCVVGRVFHHPLMKKETADKCELEILVDRSTQISDNDIKIIENFEEREDCRNHNEIITTNRHKYVLDKKEVHHPVTVHSILLTPHCAYQTINVTNPESASVEGKTEKGTDMVEYITKQSPQTGAYWLTRLNHMLEISNVKHYLIPHFDYPLRMLKTIMKDTSREKARLNVGMGLSYPVQRLSDLKMTADGLKPFTYNWLFLQAFHRCQLIFSLGQKPHGERHTCTGIAMNVTLYQMNHLPSLASIIHTVTFRVALEPQKQVIYTETIITAQRFTSISFDAGSNSTCRVMLTVNPYLPLFAHFSEKSSLPRPAQRAHPEEFSRLYYVMNGNQLLSWEEGEDVCQSLGGHLPSVTSIHDIELLERFLLGPNTQGKEGRQVPETDCRYWDPLCMMFIGINTNKRYWTDGKPVGMTHYTDRKLHFEMISYNLVKAEASRGYGNWPLWQTSNNQYEDIDSRLRLIRKLANTYSSNTWGVIYELIQQKQPNPSHNCTALYHNPGNGQLDWFTLPCLTKFTTSTLVCQINMSENRWNQNIKVVFTRSIPQWAAESNSSHMIQNTCVKNSTSMHTRCIAQSSNWIKTLYQTDQTISKQLRIVHKHLCTSPRYRRQRRIIVFCIHSLAINWVEDSNAHYGVQAVNGSLQEVGAGLCPRFWALADNLCLKTVSRHAYKYNDIIAVNMSDERKTTLVRFLGHYVIDDSVQVDCIQFLDNRGTVQGAGCSKDLRTRADAGCGTRQFQCSDGHCIADLYLCDGKKDCPDGSDETGISHACGYVANQHRFHTFQCEGRGSVHWDTLCNGVADCDDSSDEAHCIIDAKSTSITTLLSAIRNGIHMREPRLHESLSKGACSSESYALCSVGSDECFPLHRLCVFDLDTRERQRYCSLGEHLRKCEHFNCLSMFKCPGSYCIPTRRLCDDVWDCPEGEDEKRCTNELLSCPGFFRCRSGRCIHQDEVCDGYVDCDDDGDDEAQCHLTPCPPACQCRKASMICQSLSSLPYLNFITSVKLTQIANVNPFNSDGNHINFDLSRNALTQIPQGLFSNMPKLLFLNMSGNFISSIERDTFIKLMSLFTLDMSSNGLTDLGGDLFIKNKHLKYLYVSHTKLHTIHWELLQGLITLNHFDLSYTTIKRIRGDIFDMTPKLSTFDITGTNLTYFPTKEYPDNSLSITTEQTYLCCHVYLQCAVESPDWHLCPADINRVYEVAFIVYGVAMVVLNLVSILLHALQRSMSYTMKIFTVSSSLSGTLHGVYLLMVVLRDVGTDTGVVHTEGGTKHIWCVTAAWLQMVTISFSLLLKMFQAWKMYRSAASLVLVERTRDITLLALVATFLMIVSVVFMVPIITQAHTEGSLPDFSKSCSYIHLNPAATPRWMGALVIVYMLILIICILMTIVFSIKLQQILSAAVKTLTSFKVGVSGRRTVPWRVYLLAALALLANMSALVMFAVGQYGENNRVATWVKRDGKMLLFMSIPSLLSTIMHLMSVKN